MYTRTSRSTAARLNTGLLFVAALILITIVGSSYREWTEYRRASADATRTREIIDSVGNFVSDMIDAETGQRGFVLTGEARYLEPYNRAILAIPAEEANLNRLLAQSQGQAGVATQLNSLADQKLAELRQTIELRRTQGLSATLNAVLSDRGGLIMDQIRGLGADIQRREASLRTEAAVARETAARRALAITAVGSWILLAFLIVGNITINRAILTREEALSEAQSARDSLRTTIASIGDAVIATDAEGRVVLANKVAQSLLRAPEADIVGKHLDDVFTIVNEFSRAKVESPVTKVLRAGDVVGLANHTILIARDGTEIPIDDSGAPIRGEGGPIRGTVLVFRDITERRRAAQTRQLLSAIVESSGDAIISKDLHGVVTSWNKGAEQLFGYSPEEMIGQPISVLAPADRKEEMPAILERIKRGERIDNYQTVRRAKSGDLIHVSLRISPVHDALGRVIGASKIARDITAQVRAQDEVMEQRERLRVTLSSIGDAVMTTDAAGRIGYLNPIAEQLTGWASAEAAGQSLEEVFRIVNDESRHPVENPVMKVLREGGIVGLANHSVLIARDGKEISIDDTAAPIRNARGETIGVVLIFRDITRRRAEESLLALQTSEVRQRTHLLEDAYCFVRDLEDRIVYWNPGATQYYGFSEADAVGQISHTLLKTKFPAPLGGIRSQLMSEGQWDGDLVHTCRDGRIVSVASHWALHHDAEGGVESILEVNVDITERKRAEEELRAAQQQLQLVTDNMPAAVTRCSRDFRYVWVSQSYAAWLGRPPEEIAGQRIPDVVGTEGYEAIRPYVEQVLSGRRVEYTTQVNFLGPGTRWIHAIYVPTYSRDVEVDGWIAVVTDITESKRMEEERVESLAQQHSLAAERVLREKEAELARIARALTVGELATSIAHEVNQPLAGVVTNAEAGLRWLGFETPNVHEAQDSLALIVRDANRASAVIRRIREFLKKEGQERTLVDINEAIQGAVDLARSEMLRGGIALRVELSTELPVVRGDQVQLEQVILNLILNAREAMTSIMDRVRELAVTSRKSAAGVFVAVRDSGIGIEPLDMDRMFDAFFTTKIGGMGMGLSISRSIIEAHGGRIWAELNDGRPGMTVQFSLPSESAGQTSSVYE